MSAILNFLFPRKPYAPGASRLLFAARIIFGLLLMLHGLTKMEDYEALSSTFPDPLGIGSELSLILAIFAEFACSAAVIMGLLYRLALIPMMFTMCVAFFSVHGGAPFAMRELPFVYLMVFVLLFIAGPGGYAADSWIGQRLALRNK